MPVATGFYRAPWDPWSLHLVPTIGTAVVDVAALVIVIVRPGAGRR